MQEVHENRVQHQFSVGDREWVISLPPEFQRDPNVPFVQFLRPDYRVPRVLRFTASLPALDKPQRKVRLRHGGNLRYNIATYDGGSGGTEAELFGHIDMEAIAIGIVATDQDELSPHPKWCIEFLHTLRFK